MFRYLQGPRLASAALIAGLTFVTLAPSSNALASGTLSPTVTVQSSVATNCTDSVTQPNTIVYDPIGTNLTVDAKDGSGYLTLNCTRKDVVSIDLNKGANSTGTTPNFQRYMKGSVATPDTLSYKLYQDSGYATLWGSTTSGTAMSVTGLGPGTGNALKENIYIDIPMNQNVQADTYVDTVTATITF